MIEHNHYLTQQLNQSIAGLGTATDNIATLQSQLNTLTYSSGGGGSISGSVGGGTGYGGTPEEKRHRFGFAREPKR